MLQASVAWLDGPHDLAWRDESLPNIGENDIKATTLWSAISPGTEVAAFVGAPPLRPMKVYPRLVGYCNVAIVNEVGPSVSTVKSGDRIITHQSHRTAFVCPEESVLATLEPEQDARSASAAYLFHLGLSAVQKSGVTAGHRVAVVGLGTLGLAAVALAATSGAQVTAFSDQGGVAEMAAVFGASSCLPKNTDAKNIFDIVITTSNQWPDWKLALDIVRHSGVVASLGFPGRGQPAPEFNPLASEYFYDKQLTFTACGNVARSKAPEHELRFTLKRNMAWLTSMIAQGKLPADRLLSETILPDGLGRAYERLANREPNLLTMAIQWT